MQNPCLPYRGVVQFFVGLLALNLAAVLFRAEGAGAVPPPANPAEVKTRLAELLPRV